MTNKNEVIYEAAKDTAKKIRKALKANFPNTKFSVRSQVFSGGDSVYVSWTDLPLTEEVDTILNQFKSGSFNSYEDIYEYGHYSYEGKRYSGAKFISSSRELSTEYRQQIKDYMSENYPAIEENDYSYYHFFNQAEKEMHEATKQPAPIENNQTTETKQETTPAESITCTMNLNTELNGVELKFDGKPSEAVRNELKSNGFKWSKYNKCWYAKQSEKTILFAESLVSIYADIANDIQAENEATETTPEATQTAVNVQEDQSNTITPEEETKQPEPIETQYNSDNKIKVHSITFLWSESADIQSNQTVSTFEDAEQLIKKAASNAPNDGCYDKTKFKIEWSDGQTYEGRIDIVNSDLFKSAPLKEHVTSFANHVINNTHNMYSNEDQESYSHLLNTYSLEDEKQPENAITASKKDSGKVLDFNSRFKAKQEQQEVNNMTDHFINNIMPYLELDELFSLQEANDTKDQDKIDKVWKSLMIKAATRKAVEELKQN